MCLGGCFLASLFRALAADAIPLGGDGGVAKLALDLMELRSQHLHLEGPRDEGTGDAPTLFDAPEPLSMPKPLLGSRYPLVTPRLVGYGAAA